MFTAVRNYLVCAVIVIVVLGAPASVHAYSVLAHEAMVDGAWDTDIVPLLKQSYPRSTPDDLLAARAYAYGGAIIQDLGYFPFGSHFFTNLVHYVRAGDFVESLLRNAHDVNELAFAAGALAHYASDNAGHPIAVNRVVPLMYPKDRRKYGDRVIFAESPRHHLMTEFAFDVLQVARGGYGAETYHAFVGFEVAKDLLERSFQETYGLRMGDLFLDESLAIGTYRWTVGTLIPQATRIAWRDKRDEIQRVSPKVTESSFIYRLPRREFEAQYGRDYQRPGIRARLLSFFVKVLPKIGPLRSFAFKPLTPEAERLFLDSADRARTRYVALLGAARASGSALVNTDFDTGNRPVRGSNSLADETYTELQKRLEKKQFAGASPALRRELTLFFGSELAARAAAAATSR